MRLIEVTRRLVRRSWQWLLSEQSGSRPQELFAYSALLLVAALAVVAVVAALRLTRRRRATRTEVVAEPGGFSTTDLPELVPIDREPARDAGLPAVDGTPRGEEDHPHQEPHPRPEDEADAGREDSPGADVLGPPPEPSQRTPEAEDRAPEPPLLGAYRRALAQARAEARELDGAP